jgi:hypothetical protein
MINQTISHYRITGQLVSGGMSVADWCISRVMEKQSPIGSRKQRRQPVAAPFDGAPGRELTSFKSEQIRDYHWSPHGTQLGLVRGHTDSDVVPIRSPQQ